MTKFSTGLALAAALVWSAPSQGASTVAHITGIGGIFFKSPDPKKLAAWYRDVLGMKIEDWGGAILSYDAKDHPPVLVWNAFAADTKHFAPSSRDFMINFAVDDMDGFIAMLKSKHVEILKRDDDSDPSGRFAWILDPDGTKIELWQPKK
jgi:catechol 2,3-dioxygenase-like lactoylglutathione lyase family enzyme